MSNKFRLNFSSRYFLTLSYKGTQYAGWQRQPDVLGVQQVVEEAISCLFRRSVKIYGSGRTDIGVHATGQVVHFDHDARLSPKDFLHRLNAILPADVAARTLEAVSLQSHARYHANLRLYTYRLHRHKDPFLQQLSYYHPHSLDIEVMNEVAAQLLLVRDFKAFARMGSEEKAHYDCHLYQAQWQKVGQEMVFSISANRFVRSMVRAIVGTLIAVGRGQISSKDVPKIVESRKRSEAGPNAPSHGLYLTEVRYPKPLT